MGNRVCRSQAADQNAKAIKILHANGSIKNLSGPIKAGEVMKQYPGYLVCHSEAFYIGKPIVAIPSDESLKLGHTYFILPRKSFQCALTASTVASFISKVAVENHAGASRKDNIYVKMEAKPFKIVQKKGNSLQVKISTSFLNGLSDINDPSPGYLHGYKSSKKKLCDSYQLMEDYAKLVRPANRAWKPKLSTITEAERAYGKPFLLKMLSVG